MKNVYFALVFVLLLGAARVFASSNDLDRVRMQFQQYHLEETPSDVGQALKLAEDLRADGSWSDIDYTRKDRAAWPVADHISRVLVMTKAMRSPTASSTQQEALAKSIHSALAYWRQHDFKCPNWWHNNIGVPQILGQIAILLDDRLKPEEFDYITKTVLPRSGIGKSSGQNRVWLAGCTLMDGLIQRDEKKVERAASTIFSQAMVVSKGEGIQADFSFHQHGPQLKFAAYGLSFANDQIKWWTILRGTPWTASESQNDVIRRYLLDGQNWTVWKGATDISCCGRGLAPDVQSKKAETLSKLMKKMSSLDPAHSKDYLAFMKRNQPNGANDLIGCRHFWCSDYFVYRQKSFSTTLKMCSNRVRGSETCNDQNVSGYHLADGVMYVYRDGGEYRDIFPVWNWRMLPGITCALSDAPMPPLDRYTLDTDFVGGVTDGQNGCAVMDYTRDGVSAKKSWFFGGDQVVCLGSGVRATPEVKAPLVTSINQCLLRGDVRVSTGKTEKKLNAGVHSYNNLQWVEHDGIRYTLPSDHNVRISSQKQTGKWSTKVAKTCTMPTEDVSKDVFTLSIEHGAQPKDGSYAYCISPVAIKALEPFEILSNTETLQAVRFGDKLVEAVFYTLGRLDYATGHSVAVDSPCVVLLDIKNLNARVFVADPTHKLTLVGLEIDGKKRSVQLPSGNEAGKSVIVQ